MPAWRAAWMALVAIVLAFPPAAHAQSRCVAGELALPADGVWTTSPMKDLPAGRSGCFALRVVAADEISGVVVFHATAKGTAAIADAPHPRLLAEAMARLAGMNVRVTEPKWRKLDMPVSGAEGFGRGTAFGFDGTAIDDGQKSDVVIMVFDGPAFHYDVTLVGDAETTDAAEWKRTTDAFMELLARLNKVAATAGR